MARRLKLLGCCSLLALPLALGGCSGFFDQTRPVAQSHADTTSSSETLLQLGDYTRMHGDLTAAIALYRRAQAEDPGAVAPLIKLGQALAEAGNHEESAGAFRAALERAPQDAEALRGLANAYLALNRPADALPHLRLAEKARDDARVRNSLGVALDLLGQHEEAQQEYEHGLSLAPNDLDLHANLALSYALTGRSEEAQTMIDEVVAAPGATARHQHNRQLIAELAGRQSAATTARPRLTQDIAFYSGLRDRKAEARPATQARQRAAATSDAVSAPEPLPVMPVQVTSAPTPLLASLTADATTEPAPTAVAEATPEAIMPEPAAAPEAAPEQKATPEEKTADLSAATLETTPAAPVTVSNIGGPYKVQFASLPDEAEAKSTRQAILASYQALLAGRDLRIQPVDLGERGKWFRVQAVDFDRDGAHTLCDELSRLGAACLVMRAS